MPRTESAIVSTYAPRELVDEFKARAEREERSLSATVRRAMKLYLAQPEEGR